MLASQSKRADFLVFCVTNPGEDPQWYAVVNAKVYGGYDTKAELQEELAADGLMEPEGALR